MKQEPLVDFTLRLAPVTVLFCIFTISDREHRIRKLVRLHPVANQFDIISIIQAKWLVFLDALNRTLAYVSDSFVAQLLEKTFGAMSYLIVLRYILSDDWVSRMICVETISNVLNIRVIEHVKRFWVITTKNTEKEVHAVIKVSKSHIPIKHLLPPEHCLSVVVDVRIILIDLYNSSSKEAENKCDGENSEASTKSC